MNIAKVKRSHSSARGRDLAEIGEPGRPVVMGILNVTPDSFSDGGQFDTAEQAVAAGIRLSDQGVDIVDVGGESTRPGAGRVSLETELDRVLGVVAGLVAHKVSVSIDTTRAEVAAQAVAAGATLVNDVSGGLADPAMLATVAKLSVPIVLMHWRAPSDQMDSQTDYQDVVLEVRDQLASRKDAALRAGIHATRIVLDPGLGFAKLAHHNWELLANLGVLEQLGQPILVGASRKRFLSSLMAADERPTEQRDLHARRDSATHAVSALAAAHGVWGVRVHDVPGTRDAILVGNAWRTSQPGQANRSNQGGSSA